MPQKINTVGLLIDEPYSGYTNAIVEALANNGFDKEKIHILTYSEQPDKTGFKYSYNNIGLNGKLMPGKAAEFTATSFDMLISYYNTDTLPLQAVTAISAASFKVGLPNNTDALNDFVIQVDADKHAVFVNELIKYLKILNIL